MTPLMWGLLGAFLIASSVTAYLTFVVIREFVFTRGSGWELLAIITKSKADRPSLL